MFFSKEFHSLDDLFLEQLKDLYDAEHRLCDALPLMAGAAEAPELKDAFNRHLRETQEQVRRLEQVFRQLGHEPQREACEAMKGLVDEGSEMIEAKGDSAVKDAALIAAAQRVEHYEISGYGTARTFAQRLGHMAAAQLLEQTLEEEKAADHKLTEIAERSVNLQAASHA
jgi:ferritin-like metal-binding protein YciE